jgi:hypothetical protein
MGASVHVAPALIALGNFFLLLLCKSRRPHESITTKEASPMRIFLAGATGALGQSLVSSAGCTCSRDTATCLRRGLHPPTAGLAHARGGRRAARRRV